MVEGVTVSPEIVGRQGQYANDTSDPIIHATSAEECPVAAIVLNHEESHEKTGSRHGEQQANPVTEPRAAHIRIHKTTKGTAVITSSTVLRAQFGSR